MATSSTRFWTLASVHKKEQIQCSDNSACNVLLFTFYWVLKLLPSNDVGRRQLFQLDSYAHCTFQRSMKRLAVIFRQISQPICVYFNITFGGCQKNIIFFCQCLKMNHKEKRQLLISFTVI